jgi:hypothetical protein
VSGFDGVAPTRQREVVQARAFCANDGVLEIIKIEGGLKKVSQI